MAQSFQNLVEMQENSCRLFKDRPIFGTKTDDGFDWITYGQFAALVDDLRGGLARLGIARGEKVAVISGNCVEWAVGCYATYGVGGHYVPMYESQKLSEWEYIIRDSNARLLFVKSPEIYEQVKHLPETLPDLEFVVPMFDAPKLELTYVQLMETGRENPVPALELPSEETMGLIYTSGTTGNPKGVVLTHSNMLTEIISLVKVFEKMMLIPEDVGLSFLPWGHLMGQLEEVHILIYCGFSTGLVRDIKEIPQDLADVKPSLFFGVPRLYTKLYERIIQAIDEKPAVIQWLFHHGIQGNVVPGGETPSFIDRMAHGLAKRILFPKIRAIFGGRLRLAFSGGAALNESVVAFFDAVGIPIYEGYGMTETTMAVTMNSPEGRKLGSVGKMIPNAKVVIDQGLDDMKPGEGEILAYGPLVMKEYHNLPDETQACFTGDGGYRTGDVGRMDEEGFLYLTGRIKEIYKLENGKYVSPGPLEEELKFSPYINQVLIAGQNQRYNIALITPEMEPLLEYAQSAGLDTSTDEWQKSGAIQALFEKEIETYSANFKKFERPGRFRIIWEDWSQDTRLITPTLKLKRRQITQRYSQEIEGLYLNP